MSPLADQRERERIANDLDSTFVVEAAAGTGKTTALVGRIVAVLRAGRSTLDRMVCVTFTEKAAGEMKLRLRAEIEQAFETARADDERRRLEEALAALELAHINTIHGFCADLLRERPLDAGVDPAFRVLDEAASARLVNLAFDAWFERTLSDPPEAVRRVLRRRTWRAERQTPRAQLRRACVNLVEHRDFAAPWQKPSYDRNAAIDQLVRRFQGLAALAAQANNPRDPLAKSLREFGEFTDRLAEREAVRGRDYEELEAELSMFVREHDNAFKGKGHGRTYGPSLDRSAVLEERDAARQALEDFLEDAEADLAAKLKEELAPVVERFESLKGKQGALDFVDLLLSARDLLTRDAHVRGLLQERFTHIFVDEFQDTDPLQAEILLLLAAEDAHESDYRAVRVKPGKLFIVGDPKQSIYRFRRADVAFYDKIKRALLARGAELLHLTTNFRSLPAIQAAVNAAFSQVMQGAPDGSQAEYVALTPYRDATAQQPEVIALPVPAPYSAYSGRITGTAVTASYPQAVGAFLSWLLSESGFRVKEGRESVPVAARHVCLLFRRFQAYGEDLTHPYVRGLEERGIAHVLLGGRSFHDREEVVALSSALEAIEWPDDELSVYATLHGPFFGITDEELLRFRTEHGRLNALRRFEEDVAREHAAVIDALGVLRELHVRRNRRPIADTVEQLLAETRAHAALALWRSGEQVLANTLSLIEMAHAVESNGATSFRAFLDALEEQAEDGRSEAPIIEEGTEGVRLMTVHKAKGLEFPVVVLCDPTAPKEAKQGTRYVDLEQHLWAEKLAGCRPLELLANEARVRAHEEAENVRLAYVAATRASDLLVVPVFGDAGENGANVGWTDILAKALYPPPKGRSAPKPAPGCPKFGEDSVLSRPAAVQARPDDCVRPGLHLSSAGNPVVWWDPGLLELNVDYPGGLPQQDLLKESSASDAGIRAHDAWREKRTRTLAESSAVSTPATTITALARARPSLNAPRVVHTAAERAARPRGPRFGTLVHALLAEAPFDATRLGLEALATNLARLLGATAEEREAAVSAVLQALSHPLLARARAALEVRREVPVVRRLEDGTLAEGVIDLAFREANAWIIVDFKTDDPESLETYAAQLEAYVEAVRAAVSEPVEGMLLLL